MITTHKFPRARPYKLRVLDIKALVRHRDGYRCTQCGMTARQHHERYGKALDVHRLVPGSHYSLRGCVTLCRTCHGPAPRRASGQPDLAVGARPALSIPLPPDLHAQLALLARRERRSVTQMVLLLLEKALEAEGLWPPAEAPSDD